MMTWAPFTVTWPEVATSKVSTVLLSLICLMTMLPVPFWTLLSKVSTRLAAKPTPLAPFAGFRLVMTGGMPGLETVNDPPPVKNEPRAR